MIYDTFEVKGNCQGCGKPTYWHIDGSYPTCADCMNDLVIDYKRVMNENSGVDA
jgi:endogenous inhibitor of DNA gyrase (YacG/DUF329 family)